MSKELAPLPALPRQLLPLRQAAQEAVEAADPRKPLTALDISNDGMSLAFSQQKKRFVFSMVPFCLGTAGGTLGGLNMAFPHVPGGEGAFIPMALAAWIFGAGVVTTLTGLPGQIRHARSYTALQKIAVVRFCIWAQRRYGINVDSFRCLENANLLYMLTTGYHADPVSFQDVHGKKYDLVFRERGMVVETQESEVREHPNLVEAFSDKSPRTLGGTPAETDEVLEEESLPGEMAVLHERLGDMFNRLQSCNLSTENEHILKRVVADTRQVLTLRRKMLSLGPVPEASQRIFTDTLALLVDELTQVLNGEMADLASEAAATQRYVAERRMNLSDKSGLALPQSKTDTTMDVVKLGKAQSAKEISVHE